MKIKHSTIHLILGIIWLGLLYPTIFYWKESILWLGLMSIYAIIVGHWGAYEAAKADENNT